MPEITSAELFCMDCGYSLRGIESDRCPECGIVLDWKRLSGARIPWEHRKRLGTTRAFLQTMWMVFRRPGKFAAEIERPVNLLDAQRFRWVVVVLTFIPVIIGVMALRIMYDPKQPLPGLEGLPRGVYAQLSGHTQWQELVLCYWAGALLWPMPVIAIFLCIAGMTGVASYLFHPKSIPMQRQNRAIALSYYACAPLSLSFIVVALVAVMTVLDLQRILTRLPSAVVGGLGVVFYLAFFSVLGSWWYATLRMLGAATRCSRSRLALAALSVPSMWMALLALTCGLLPFLVGLLWLIIRG